MHFTENGTLKTTDTALAAHLITQGYDMLSIEFADNGQALFLFSNSFEIQRLIDPFYRGHVYQFFRVYRGLLKKLKSRQQETGHAK